MNGTRPVIRFGIVSQGLILANVVMSFIYLLWWIFYAEPGNPVLFSLLFAGEIYHLFMAYTFWHTVTPPEADSDVPRKVTISDDWQPTVDIYITVAGEPASVIRETARAARDMEYPSHTVYILNDGYVTEKPEWEAAEHVARDLGIRCITRKQPGGAKAGNINNALGQTDGEFIAIFDADMVPHADFLKRVMPYFREPGVGLVQTPQYYKNHMTNRVTQGAWRQQEVFFGPILRGKDTHNAAFLCGTNAVLRKKALTEAGGMYDKSITEDVLTSLHIHRLGWRSRYIPDVVAEGLAPMDMGAYYKQQYRWTRGSLDLMFSHNPLFMRGLSWAQKFQYLSSAAYYMNGIVVAIDMMMPLLFLYFGLETVRATTTSFAVFFIPYIILNIYTLYVASGGSLRFSSLGLSHGAFYLQIAALKSILLGEKVGFAVTPKRKQEGNFTHLAYPHLIYIALSALGMAYAVSRFGLTVAVTTNIAWILFNIAMFVPFIKLAFAGNAGTVEPVGRKAYDIR